MHYDNGQGQIFEQRDVYGKEILVLMPFLAAGGGSEMLPPTLLLSYASCII